MYGYSPKWLLTLVSTRLTCLGWSNKKSPWFAWAKKKMD